VLGTLAISVQSAQDQHGYTVIEFNVPGFQDTFPEDNNPAGAIVGKARDASGEGPAFVRAPDGTITIFQASNAATLTAAYSINPAGAITGSYLDLTDTIHGFVRAPNGAITSFDAPGAGTGTDNGTSAQNINRRERLQGGTLTITPCNTVSCAPPAVRSRLSTLPGAGTGPGQGTFPDGINDAGAITGYHIDDNDVLHGFLRTPTHGSR